MNFAIICNSGAPDLYKHSRSFYEHLPYDKIRVPGDNGFYNFKFVHTLIQDSTKYPYDWVALIDEDCFITDTDAMMDLVKYQMENNIHMSGMSDGGLIPLREFNPVGINTYFTVLNLKRIRKTYNPKEVEGAKYDKTLDKYIRHDLIKGNYFSSIVTHTKKRCDPYNFEPYYKIFFWLLKKGYKMEYLDAELWRPGQDKFTNILKNHEGKTFAYHTWRSRFWKSAPKNRERMSIVINHCKKIRNI